LEWVSWKPELDSLLIYETGTQFFKNREWIWVCFLKLFFLNEGLEPVVLFGRIFAIADKKKLEKIGKFHYIE